MKGDAWDDVPEDIADWIGRRVAEHVRAQQESEAPRDVA